MWLMSVLRPVNRREDPRSRSHVTNKSLWCHGNSCQPRMKINLDCSHCGGYPVTLFCSSWTQILFELFPIFINWLRILAESASQPSGHTQICIVPWQFIFDPFQQSLRRIESHGAGGHFGGDKDLLSWDAAVEEARKQGIRKAGIPRWICWTSIGNPLKIAWNSNNIIDVSNHASHLVWHVTYMTYTHAEMHLSAVSMFLILDIHMKSYEIIWKIWGLISGIDQNLWNYMKLPYDWEKHPAPAIFRLGSLRSGRIEMTVAGLQGVRDDVLKGSLRGWW